MLELRARRKMIYASSAATHKRPPSIGSDDPARRPHPPDRLPLRPRNLDGAPDRPAEAGAALPHAHPELLAQHRAEDALHQLAAGPLRQLLRPGGAAGED